MIDSSVIQSAQSRNGWFECGSGPKKVLLLTSCRGIPHLNYLNDLNAGNDFTLCYIDPLYYTWAENGDHRDVNAVITGLENDRDIWELIASVDWFIHEGFMDFGMFNTSAMCPKNIYGYGMKPEMDVSLPNFYNFILFQDLVDYTVFKEDAKRELANEGKLSKELQCKMRDYGLNEVEKFCLECRMSSFPEFGGLFSGGWTHTRFYWTANHVSSVFTTELFCMMNDRFLKLSVPSDLWFKWRSEDVFAPVFVPLTQYDVDNYGITWKEPVVELKAP